MKLEEIGFYTLSDTRAETASSSSPLMRCELILTDNCNFKCAYCRSLRADCRGDLSFKNALGVVHAWATQGLSSIRFSGGEPTLWNNLDLLITNAAVLGIRNIAVSTNGSAPIKTYDKLLLAGATDFSVSLDACCAATGARMCGRKGEWERVTSNIEWLTQRTYVTVGIVLTSNNQAEALQIIELADLLGVADIRIIPAAQYNKELNNITLDARFDKYKILKYRINNTLQGKPIRGINPQDFNRCPLVLDDMAVAGMYHFPCIIYLREHGEPIGEFDDVSQVRAARQCWFYAHDTHKDPICNKNCLDVCVEYNNKWKSLHDEP